VWTVMLLISLIALLIAALVLYLEIREYGGFGNVKGPSGAVLTTVQPAIQTA
jgi:hypothetical protein